MVDLVQRFFQQADTAQRSTALNPLGWMLLTLAGLLIAALHAQAADWIQIALLILVCLAAVFYLGAYAYFAWVNPDALRSERYTLAKIAIERGIQGDNLVGLIMPADEARPAIPPLDDDSEATK